jgi:hypothetical protein
MKRALTLVQRFDRSWQAWNKALDGLDGADFELPVYPKWRLKDILGHVYSYMDLMRRHVESYKKRKRLASPRAPSYSYFNRREAERLRQVPAADLRADLDSAYCKLMELLPTLTDDDFKKSFPSQWWNSNGRTTLRGILREEANHISTHAEDIRKWRVREHVGG